MSYKINEFLRSFSGTEDFFKYATKTVYQNKEEFDEYFRSSSKLAAVKRLKDITGGGLKECKEICDLFWENKLPNFVREDRKEKLEKLAKAPLVNQLIEKLLNIKEDKLQSLLMNLTVDELLSIDEFFSESTESFFDV